MSTRQYGAMVASVTGPRARSTLLAISQKLSPGRTIHTAGGGAMVAGGLGACGAPAGCGLARADGAVGGIVVVAGIVVVVVEVDVVVDEVVVVVDEVVDPAAGTVVGGGGGVVGPDPELTVNGEVDVTTGSYPRFVVGLEFSTIATRTVGFGAPINDARLVSVVVP
jgi:hypothetical protein